MMAVDVHPPCRGKAEGLRWLEERYGIPPARVVAVGDATNDLPMIEEAGLGVVMSNGMPEAKERADRLIGDNNSDALAELIEELFGPSAAPRPDGALFSWVRIIASGKGRSRGTRRPS